MMPAPLCFLDTETTGVHPNRKVWEIAMIRQVDGEWTETAFFVQVDLDEADPRGLEIGRFYQRHPLGIAFSERHGQFPCPDDELGTYVTPEEAAFRVARWTHGAHLVGAVPNFDAEVLDGLLRYWGLIPAWHYHLIDVEALAVGYLHGLAQFDGHVCKDGVRTWSVETIYGTAPTPPWNSNELSEMLGVDPPGEDERHTALGDAYWAMRLYHAITGGAST